MSNRRKPSLWRSVVALARRGLVTPSIAAELGVSTEYVRKTLYRKGVAFKLKRRPNPARARMSDDEITHAIVERVRAAICREISLHVDGDWAVPFSLDAVARAAAQETVAALKAKEPPT